MAGRDITVTGVALNDTEFRTDNWREVLQQMSEKYRKKKEICSKASVLYFKLDIGIHYFPLMLMMLTIAILAIVTMGYADKGTIQMFLNAFIAGIALLAVIWTGFQIKFAWAEKRATYKTGAKKYEYLYNEVQYRLLISKEEADHAAFYKWLWDSEKDIDVETDHIPYSIINKVENINGRESSSKIEPEPRKPSNAFQIPVPVPKPTA